MNVLAIETSTPVCSIAIETKDAVFYRISTEKENSHGVLIFKYIDECLKDAKIAKEDLDLIILSNGPGSFTGLRVGCSVAQGLALGLGIEIIPYSSLRVTAQANFNHHKDSSEIKIIQDAHMNDYYLGHYKKNDLGTAIKVCEDFVIKKEKLPSFIKKDFKGEYAGDTASLARGLSNLENVFDRKTMDFISLAPSAIALLKTAKHDLQNTDLRKKPEEVFPVYLSGSDQWVKHE